MTEYDVIVVGGGAAGFVAALSAREAGAEVALLEGRAAAGGTTEKSSGGYWTPNNRFLREKGLQDPREDALRHMACLAYPREFAPDATDLGLSVEALELIANYYDHGSEVIEWLNYRGYLRSMEMLSFSPHPEGMPPWHPTPYDRAPRGRLLAVTASEVAEQNRESLSAAVQRELSGGAQGSGHDMIVQLSAATEGLGIDLLLEHRVEDVTVDRDGAVSGVRAGTPEGPVILSARRGVVFATGGFSRNPELAAAYLRGPIAGSGAASGSQGDFISIAARLGAQLGNMSEAWWGQVPLEPAIGNAELPDFISFIYGDSSILVNAAGDRVVNEKLLYNERTKIHFARDAEGRYPNRVLFMVFDEAVLSDPRNWPSRMPVPMPGEEADHVISAESWDGLAGAIGERLAAIGEAAMGVRLAPDFAERLVASVERFDGFARAGVDDDFQRGAGETDRELSPPGREGSPNNTMHPFASSGPYHCVLIGAGTLDTKGGPRIDAEGRVLGASGRPIPGLYGAGNCVDEGAGEAYWGGGSTLGPAMTYGFLAGRAAASDRA